jgi:dsRNA-specific ribonuclease
VAEKFIIGLLEHPDTLIDMTELITDDGNYKIKLRNYLRRMRQTDPIYTTTENPETGDYTCQITTKRNRDTVIGTATTSNNKDAEHAAASIALQNYFGISD